MTQTEIRQVTDQINYEAEVKRVYPDAMCKWSSHHKVYCIWSLAYFDENPICVIAYGTKSSQQSAWERAYNTLKQQGKL